MNQSHIASISAPVANNGTGEAYPAEPTGMGGPVGKGGVATNKTDVATSKEPHCLSGPTRCEKGYDSCHAAETVRRPGVRRDLSFDVHTIVHGRLAFRKT